MVKIVCEIPLSFRVEPELLEGRRDIWYYRPGFLEVEEELRRMQLKQLKEIAEFSKLIIDPTQKPNEDFTYIDISSVDIISGEITPQKIIGKKAPLRARKLVKAGDIIISTVRPNRNAVAIIPDHLDNSVCSTGFAVVQAKDVTIRYLFTFLKTRYAVNQLTRRVTATMYPAVLEREIASIKIPIMTKELQEKVAKIMFRSLAQRKQKIQRADELVGKMDVVVLDVLGIEMPQVKDEPTYWVASNDLQARRDTRFYQPRYTAVIEELHKSPYEIKIIEEIADAVICGPFGSEIKVSDYREKGIPLVRITNMKNGEFDDSDLVSIPEELSEKLRNTQLTSGDIVVSQRGTIGNVAQIPNSIPVCNISANIIGIRKSDRIDFDYVLAFLTSPLARSQFEQRTSGHVQSKITTEDVKSIKIIVPKEATQEKIAEAVRRLRDELQIIKKESDEVTERAKRQVEEIIKGRVR